MNKAQKILKEFAESPFHANVGEDDFVKELIRTSLASELDAISLYEQVLAQTDNEEMIKVFEHVLSEEKDHLELFNSLLKKFDKEQANKEGYSVEET
jgi:rubrerythrin